jgi:DNA polymerase III delta prime subunit
MTTHKLWVEKYRPTNLKKYIFQNQKHKESIKEMLQNKSIPHLLFSGVQGCGKTTLAKILISELNIDSCDVLTINASDVTGVDNIRDNITEFVSSYAMSAFKIVNLEEADYLSLNAQGCLRHVMETFSDNARFILTCNLDHKIIPAIKSRCQQFIFKAPDKDQILNSVIRMLLAEKIEFDGDDVMQYVNIAYPDIRKIIQLLQQNSIDGVLKPSSNVDSGSAGYEVQLLDLISKDDWVSARELICSSIAEANEFEQIYEFLYRNLDKSKKFSNYDLWEKGIVIISDHLYKHHVFSTPEICMASLLINLSLVN